MRINLLPDKKTIVRIVRRSAAGLLIGGLLGFLFYHFIGCHSGTCPITGNPYNSVITGSIFGIIIAFPSDIKFPNK